MVPGKYRYSAYNLSFYEFLDRISVSSVHGTRNEWVGVCHDRVGIIFFSGMWGSVWGSSRRLQVPYVIPRPGVTRHIKSSPKIPSPNRILFLRSRICIHICNIWIFDKLLCSFYKDVDTESFIFCLCYY